MKLAHIMSPTRGETDPLLARIASQLAGVGVRICGAVRKNTPRPDSPARDMDLVVLLDGPVLRILQHRGPGAHGCRFDAGSREMAVEAVGRRLDLGADLMIINKFGKHEAEGRGFRTLIARAIDLGVPVLVGLNSLNKEAFDRFADGIATAVPADCNVIPDWANLFANCDDQPHKQFELHS